MTERGTYASMFTGGDGWGIGARAAGYRSLWGIECESAIADVAEANGAKGVIRDYVQCVDPLELEKPEILLTSPSCKQASGANPNGGETELDRICARAVANFLRVLEPPMFCLENVGGYAKFESMDIIRQALQDVYGWWDEAVFNSADYAVPQTRKRFIVRANGGFVAPVPKVGRWIGWYEAIEDLIPTLPESHFAPWQEKRLEQMGFPDICFPRNDTKGVNSSDATEGIARKVLSELRAAVGSEVFLKWCDGVLCGFEEANLLFASVHGRSVSSKTEEVSKGRGCLTLPFAANGSGGGLLSLWGAECNGRTPQEQQSNGQLNRELAAYLSQLSHEDSQPSKDLLNMRGSSFEQGVLQQTLSSFQKIWRSTVHAIQCAGSQKEAGSYSSSSGCQGENEEMGSEFRETFGQSEKGTIWKPSAFLIEGDAAGDRCPTVLQQDAPAFRLKAGGGGRVHRAFLMPVNGENSGPLEQVPPAPTVTGAHGVEKYRAFIVEGTAAGVDNKFSLPVRTDENPIFTVRGSNPLRAFLVGEDSKLTTVCAGDESQTVVSSHRSLNSRAFLIDGQNAGRDITVRQEGETRFTLTGSGKGTPKAFLMNSTDSGPEARPGLRFAEDPSATIRVSSIQKAFLVDGKPLNYAGDLCVKQSCEAIPTVTASQEKHPFRAWLDKGRVVSMTVRALARFQSFPDWYVFPQGKGSKGIATTIIGNAVPPLMAEAMIRSLSA